MPDLCQLEKFQDPCDNLPWIDKKENNKNISSNKVGLIIDFPSQAGIPDETGDNKYISSDKAKDNE